MYITRIATAAAILLVAISTSPSAQMYNQPGMNQPMRTAPPMGTVSTERTTPPPGTIAVPRCFIKLIDKAHIAAEESGILTKVYVSDGERVRKGQKLAQVDDTLAKLQWDVSQAELNVAKKEAQNRIAVEYAEKNAATAEREVQRHKEANERMPGAVSASDVDKAKLEWAAGLANVEKAKFDLEVKAEEVTVKEASLKAAEEHIRRRTVTAPCDWDGAVAEIIRHEGDWVEPGNPILQLVRMDKLRINCLINGNDYNKYQVIGKDVVVTVYLARGQAETFRGKITGVSPKSQADNYFEAWADIENRERNGYWLLSEGMTGSMKIFVNPR